MISSRKSVQRVDIIIAVINSLRHACLIGVKQPGGEDGIWVRQNVNADLVVEVLAGCIGQLTIRFQNKLNVAHADQIGMCTKTKSVCKVRIIQPVVDWHADIVQK